MCLQLVKGKARVKTAKEDIICWKVLNYYASPNNDVYISPYQKIEYKIGERVVIDKPWDRMQFQSYCFGNSGDATYFYQISHIINGGGVYTFKDKDEAMDFMKWMQEEHKETVVAIKCIIPKGTKYYKGLFQVLGYKSEKPIESYASKELFVMDEVIWSQNNVQKGIEK